MKRQNLWICAVLPQNNGSVLGAGAPRVIPSSARSITALKGQSCGSLVCLEACVQELHVMGNNQ